jgi:hypothetical protein
MKKRLANKEKPGTPESRVESSGQRREPVKNPELSMSGAGGPADAAAGIFVVIEQ